MINFSGISRNSLIGRLLRRALRIIPRGTIVPILQGGLRGKRWIIGSSNEGCSLGSYEFHKRRIFERTIRPGSAVFDIGAHVGFYTLLSSVIVGPGGRVFAFEPLTVNFEYLRRHLELNSVTNATGLPVGVWRTGGVTRFRQGNSSLTGRFAMDGDVEVQGCGH